MKKTVYIAGPMRGRRLFGFPDFDHAESVAQFYGFLAVSPARLDRDSGFDPASLGDDWDWNKLPDGFNIRETLARDVDALLKCDCIAMLPGWEKSSGARMELSAALAAGLEVLDAVYFKPMEVMTEMSWLKPKEGSTAFVGDGSVVAVKSEEIKVGDKLVLDSGARRIFSSGANRDRAEGKGAFNQLPFHGLLEVAQVYEAGGKKYTKDNWKLGMPISEYLNSAFRHIVKACQGWNDEPHIGMCAWNCLCAIETRAMIQKNHLPTELDDVRDWLSGEGVQKAFEQIRLENQKKLSASAA